MAVHPLSDHDDPPQLPAETTTSTPALTAPSIAELMACVLALLPRLRLMTFAPFETAHEMPAATASVVPLPLSARTLTGMIETGRVPATPATPMALSVAAAMMPATCVPWPSPSDGIDSAFVDAYARHVPLSQRPHVEFGARRETRSG